MQKRFQTTYAAFTSAPIQKAQRARETAPTQCFTALSVQIIHSQKVHILQKFVQTR